MVSQPPLAVPKPITASEPPSLPPKPLPPLPPSLHPHPNPNSVPLNSIKPLSTPNVHVSAYIHPHDPFHPAHQRPVTQQSSRAPSLSPSSNTSVSPHDPFHPSHQHAPHSSSKPSPLNTR